MFEYSFLYSFTGLPGTYALSSATKILQEYFKKLECIWLCIFTDMSGLDALRCYGDDSSEEDEEEETNIIKGWFT